MLPVYLLAGAHHLVLYLLKRATLTAMATKIVFRFVHELEIGTSQDFFITNVPQTTQNPTENPAAMPK